MGGRSKSEVISGSGVINGKDGIVMERTPAIQRDTHDHGEGASEESDGTLGTLGGGISKEGIGTSEGIKQHDLDSLFGEHSDLTKEQEDNEDTVLKNVILGGYEDELLNANKEWNKERTEGNIVDKNLVDGFDVGWSSGTNGQMKSRGHSEEQEEPSSEGAFQSGSILEEEGSLSKKEHLSRERDGSLLNQQGSSLSPGVGQETKAGRGGEAEKANKWASPLANKVPQNTVVTKGGERRIEEDLKSKDLLANSRPSEKGSVKLNDKAEESKKSKQTSENTSGVTVAAKGSLENTDEEEDTVFKAGSLSDGPSSSSSLSDRPFSRGSLSNGPSSSGRPRSLGTADRPLLLQPGIDELTIDEEKNSLEPSNEEHSIGPVKEENSLESGKEETKEDAKNTKNNSSTSVSALPDKSGRCDHLTEENLILRCKVIACFRNVAHCYN